MCFDLLFVGISSDPLKTKVIVTDQSQETQITQQTNQHLKQEQECMSIVLRAGKHGSRAKYGNSM